MKWISHKLISFAVCYTVSDNPISSLIASPSSTLPDLIEMGPGRLTFQKHRGTSHNPLFWIAVLPLFYYLMKKTTPELSMIPLSYIPKPESLFLAVATGVTLHLLTDSLSSSGIPFLGNKRIALKAYKTFIPSEFAVVTLLLLFCGLGFTIRRLFVL